MLPALVFAQGISQPSPASPAPQPTPVDICEVVPNAPQCAAARQVDFTTVAPARVKNARILPLVKPEKPEEPEVVSVRVSAPPRSASDWQVDADALHAIPHETGADVLGMLPGVFVSNRGLLGQAPHLALRGFEGTSGQDMELYVGAIPMNQISNVRAPGYADLRLVVPETIRGLRISHGPYDPRQGDFAIAGSAHMELGLDEPGFLGKATLGSFGTKRALLAFAPNEENWRDSFAAVEVYSTDGPGMGRGGDRASLVGQLAYVDGRFAWHGIALIGTARFDYPGLLSLADVQRGLDPYSAVAPLGRDLSSQVHVGNQLVWEVNDGSLRFDSFVSLTRMQFHENLTGYVLDVAAGMPPVNGDDGEQVNQATTIGLTVAYRHTLKLLDEHDVIEIGAVARRDWIDQSDTRLLPDGTINTRRIDASIGATGIGGYVDAAIHPLPRIVVRGGTRFDSLAYSVDDRTNNQGLERTSQGVHLGNKATVDYAAGSGWHLVASYGEGFRSPEAIGLVEGERIPFATIRSVEAGARVKEKGASGSSWQASFAGFASWLSEDLVFDALARSSTPAPSSSRVGGTAAVVVRHGVLGASTSATYVRATFTGTDDRFHDGDAVPYQPAFVLRDDTFLAAKLWTLGGDAASGRFGIGVQGAFGGSLPDGQAAQPALYIDALATVGWRALELSINAMNLLDQRYSDQELVYVSNFARSATLPPATAHVLVAAPASVFATLQVRLGAPGRPKDHLLE
jgi:hypothetical protein